MKVGSIELETTAEELNEIGVTAVDGLSEESVSAFVGILKQTKLDIEDEGILEVIVGGIFIGAELYRRRLREAGERIMTDVSDADLA